MKTSLSLTGAILVVYATLFSGHALAGKPEQIVKCVRANVPLTASSRSITLTRQTQTETTEMSGRLYMLRELQEDNSALLRAVLALEAPPSLSGAAYLVRENRNDANESMFVYLPGVGRVRRIAGGFADGPMMGTDFSYFEFKQLIDTFSDLTPSVGPVHTVSGRAAQVLDFTPRPGTETVYSRIRTWIDHNTCLPLKAEFMRGDRVVKRMVVPPTSITKYGKRWCMNEVRMTDIAKGSTTILSVDEVTFNEPLSSSRFNPGSFYRTK